MIRVKVTQTGNKCKCVYIILYYFEYLLLINDNIEVID